MPKNVTSRQNIKIMLKNDQLNIFVWMQHGCLSNMIFALDPSSSVIKRLGQMMLVLER